MRHSATVARAVYIVNAWLFFIVTSTNINCKICPFMHSCAYNTLYISSTCRGCTIARWNIQKERVKQWSESLSLTIISYPMERIQAVCKQLQHHFHPSHHHTLYPTVHCNTFQLFLHMECCHWPVGCYLAVQLCTLKWYNIGKTQKQNALAFTCTVVTYILVNLRRGINVLWPQIPWSLLNKA